MIVYDLICQEQHRFEGWFPSGDEFACQREGGLLSCPICGSSEVRRVPSVARIGKERGEGSACAENAGQEPPPAAPSLSTLIDWVLKNSEDVGPEFSREARRIHQREAPQRTIRGSASREETEALQDEGIDVVFLPLPPRPDWH